MFIIVQVRLRLWDQSLSLENEDTTMKYHTDHTSAIKPNPQQLKGQTEPIIIRLVSAWKEMTNTCSGLIADVENTPCFLILDLS